MEANSFLYETGSKKTSNGNVRLVLDKTLQKIDTSFDKSLQQFLANSMESPRKSPEELLKKCPEKILDKFLIKLLEVCLEKFR